MRTDSMEKTEQTVYILNGITLLPHYILPCFVTPGFTSHTPMKLWTVRELDEQGATKSSAFLWPRGLLAQSSHRGWSA